MHGRIQWIIILLFVAQSAISATTAPGHKIPGLKGATLELRFSEPDCGVHYYETPQATKSGDLVKSKPPGVYCRGRDNFFDSIRWTHSARAKLLEWIKDKTTKEVFFGYQSVTDNTILKTLCEEIRDRHLKVTFVMSRNRGPKDPLIKESGGLEIETPKTQSSFKRVMTTLTNCGLGADAPQPVGLLRGHSGPSQGRSIGWAHNKFFIVNPKSKKSFQFSMGSGNMSAIGVGTNLENWLFFHDVPVKSQMAQETLCLMNSLIEDKAHISRRDYQNYMNQCLAAIPKDVAQHQGMDFYFVPGDGQKAIEEIIVPAFNTSKRITMAAHLFGHPSLFERGLACAAMKSPEEKCFKKIAETPGFNVKGGAEVRLILDDDIHWIREGQTKEDGSVGFNRPWEASRVTRVEEAGGQIRYIQTAHQEGSFQIHHNKILLFEGGEKADFVWTGAGNFTKAAFYSNLENYLVITIPSVVEAYRSHLNDLWNVVGTPGDRMPLMDVTPLLPEAKATPEG